MMNNFNNRPRQGGTAFSIFSATWLRCTMACFPYLSIGERLHTELDEPYIANSDRVLADPLSATELRKAWAEVNDKLTRAFEGFTLEDSLQKHTAVSDEDFIKDPMRNRLAVVMNRTSHASYRAGQAALTNEPTREASAVESLQQVLGQ